MEPKYDGDVSSSCPPYQWNLETIFWCNQQAKVLEWHLSPAVAWQSMKPPWSTRLPTALSVWIFRILRVLQFAPLTLSQCPVLSSWGLVGKPTHIFCQIQGLAFVFPSFTFDSLWLWFNAIFLPFRQHSSNIPSINAPYSHTLRSRSLNS